MSDTFVVDGSGAASGDPFATPRRLVPIAGLAYAFVRMLDAVQSGSSQLPIGTATIIAAVAGFGMLCGYFSLHPALETVPMARWRSTNPEYWERLCMGIAMTIVVVAILHMASREAGQLWDTLR